MKLGHHDTVSPFAVTGTTIASSVYPTQVSLRWTGAADDTNGIGVWGYSVYRNGVVVGAPGTAEFIDNTAAPSTSYTYVIYTGDQHGNWSSGTTVTVSTPPAQSIDPRRVGLFTTGSYWGGGGEQIDTLSGNLNFTLPLLKAQGRNGWTVPVNLSYNSQNWRQDGGVNWQLGDDVGYGFGWKAQIGSITPYYTNWWAGVDHYVFEDGTGAQYRLDQNNGGVWSSTQGIYVWFDANANVLHFKDGTFWNMGCTSGGTEADAGTMYPTIIEDVNGNQVIVTYQAGAGLPSGNTNTSARFSSLEDVRGKGSSTYTFMWNSDAPIPHLTGIRNYIATGENFTFTYAENATLEPAFGSDANWAGQTTTHLASLAPISSTGAVLVTPYMFTYDTAGAAELLQVTFPYGGHLRWSYGNDAYVGSRKLRAVTGRYLAADSAGATEWSYGISRDNASSQTIHGTMTLTDASGVGTKTWNFIQPGGSAPAWQVGLVSSFVQSGSAVLQSDSYTWSQTPTSLNPYISAKTSAMNPGGSNAQSALSTQTLDQYGNATGAVTYPYNNTTTPLRTYASSYLNSSTYTSHYIFDRLVTTTMTTGGVMKTLVTNTYDAYGAYTPYGYAPPTLEIDASPSIPFSHRGLLTSSVTPAKSSAMNYYSYGGLATGAGSDGTSVTASADSSTNYAAPQSIATQSYSETVSYNSWLGITQTTGANGEQLSMVYDPYTGRPTSGVSPYGATTVYGYSNSGVLPAWQTQNGPTGVTATTLDGMGRAIKVVTNGAEVDTVYAPCACSPLGKVQKVSAPYAAGGSPAGWTIYSYDGLGRTLSVQQPDGASTTTTSYSGNQTTVTDPAGNWKTFTSDVEGNLVSVVEPDPSNQPGGTLATTYTYDWMNHLAGVSMPRGATTQTRTFVYDDAGRLTSATNPENGTVSYYYNGDNTLNYKHDANGIDTVYTYDGQKRVTVVQRYPWGKNNSEDLCQHVTYSYDTNPYDSSGTFQYTLGRLAAAVYPVCAIPAQGWTPSVTEMYSYTPAGLVTIKRMHIFQPYYDDSGNGHQAWDDVQANYTYTGWGAVSSVTLPTQSTYVESCTCNPSIVPVTYSYGFDSAGRPTSLVDNNQNATNGVGTTWVQNVQYDYAGRLTNWQRYAGTFNDPYGNPVDTSSIETRAYNVSGQLTQMNWSQNSANTPGLWSTPTGIQYVYSPTQNNGQITQSVESISAQTVTYRYDALKRLISAAATATGAGSPAPWTQTFGYDGYGNLTSKTLNGTTTSIPAKTLIDPKSGNQIATNQLANASYDFNGNMTSGAGLTLRYDEANRIAAATPVSGGTEYYNYDPSNHRVVRVPAPTALEPTPTPEWTFWGAHGERLGTFNVTTSYYGDGSFGYYYSVMTPVVWFAGKQVQAVNDRLGTPRIYGASTLPYGEKNGSAYYSGGFATYWMDGFTGLHYAEQRYYASSYGRFNRVDPSRRSAKRRDPGTWNRYGYVGGDPINRNDPRGLMACNGGEEDIDECIGLRSELLGDGGADDDPAPEGDYDPDPDQGDKTTQTTQSGQANSQSQAPPAPPSCPPPQLGLGAGATFGGSAEAGVGAAGASAQASAGVGGFVGLSGQASAAVLVNGVATANAGSKVAGTPVQPKPPFVIGAFAGYGPGIFFTNAGSAQQFAGPFDTFTINIGFGMGQATVSLGNSGPVWVLSISGGPAPVAAGLGASASLVTTTTAVSGVSTSQCP